MTTACKHVIRTARYLRELTEIVSYIAARNPVAAARLYDRIERQVDRLADPNFPRRMGRKKGERELVAHPNYVVMLREEGFEVVVLRVVHSRRAYP